jgi:hypothetical protein
MAIVSYVQLMIATHARSNAKIVRLGVYPSDFSSVRRLLSSPSAQERC